MKRSVTGFTIVELLIVIVVIAILAAISVVAYTGIQVRASDSRMRAGVSQFERALYIWAQDHPLPIRGGSGSTTAVSNGECSNGSTGFVGSSSYTCTVDDALVSAGVLPSGFVYGLPGNTHFGPYPNGSRSLMLYTCSTGGYSLYWTLQNPSAEDTASIDSILATCGNSTMYGTHGECGPVKFFGFRTSYSMLNFAMV